MLPTDDIVYLKGVGPDRAKVLAAELGVRSALDLLDYSMVAVVVSETFNSEGVHFETTFSRHRPDFFTFHDTAMRGY